ncbi:MAG: response regulator [Planctomycetota bacterium]|jgi:CheY-like chemotaxis protein
MQSDNNNRRILIVDDTAQIHEDFDKILLSGGDAGGAGSEVDDLLDAFLGGDEPAPAAPTQSAPVEADWEVVHARQGEEALQLVREARAEQRPFAMAFVDVRMPPGWDGVETLGHIWKEEPDLQAVLCTAFSDYSYAEMIEKLGKTDRLLILKKPFDKVEVQQLASALCEKWSTLRSERARMEELSAYAASLETVNRALETDRATNQAYQQRHVDQFLSATGRFGEEARFIARGVAESIERDPRLSQVGARTSSLVEEIGQFSALIALENGRVELDPKPTPLSALLERVQMRIRGAVHRHDRLQILASGLPEELEVDGDVLADLLTALGRGGLDLSPNGQVVLRIAQEPPHLTARLFLPGFNLDGPTGNELFEPFSGDRALHLPLAQRLARTLGTELQLRCDEDATSIEVHLASGFASQDRRAA